MLGRLTRVAVALVEAGALLCLSTGSEGWPAPDVGYVEIRPGPELTPSRPPSTPSSSTRSTSSAPSSSVQSSSTPSSGPPSSTDPTQANPTPANPTPANPTQAPAGTPAAPIVVLALGDSVTAGSHCDCDAFPWLYADGVASRTRTTVRLRNDGVSGETSADVLADLTSDREEEAEVSTADVVLLTIGANDFGNLHDTIGTSDCGSGEDHLGCTAGGLAQLGTNLDAILARITRLRAGRATLVLTTGYWNIFEDGEIAGEALSGSGQRASDRLTRSVNQVEAAAAARAGATYVDLYAPFKGRDGGHDPTSLLADDGDHPNAAGHRVIAQALLAHTPASLRHVGTG